MSREVAKKGDWNIVKFLYGTRAKGMTTRFMRLLDEMMVASKMSM